LSVYRYSGASEFHIAHAKNVAARCGILEGADILVTLDADNFTGADFAVRIAQAFSEFKPSSRMVMCPDIQHIQSLPWDENRPLRGYAGRLAIRAQDFIKAGGYDEQFNIWGSEDTDLLFRLERLGYTKQYFNIQNLKTIPHNGGVRFREYPHAKQNEGKHHIRNLQARGGTVVNNGQFGVGMVTRNGSPTPILLNPMPTRIFGIGLQKTATNSLDTAFRILGLDSLHWGTGEAPLIWQEMQANGRSVTLELFYALSDLPIPLFYPALDRAYPGSKFILTIRDEGDWIKSVAKMWDVRYNPTRYLWDIYPISNRLHRALYGRTDFDAETFLMRYRKHNAEVREYFKHRPKDLLVMDMSGDAGTKWEELCRFLGYAVPNVPYPRSYQTKDLVEAVDYCEEPPKLLLVLNSGSRGSIEGLEFVSKEPSKPRAAIGTETVWKLRPAFQLARKPLKWLFNILLWGFAVATVFAIYLVVCKLSSGSIKPTGGGVISANQINNTALSGLATGPLCNTTSTGRITSGTLTTGMLKNNASSVPSIGADCADYVSANGLNK
jgi:hypothetical protein